MFRNTVTWGKVLRVLAPPFLVFMLFVTSIYCLAIPSMQSNLFNARQDFVRALTQMAWNIVEDYDEQARNNVLTLEEAQKRALTKLNVMLQSTAQRESVWVYSEEGTILLDPNRPDLEGKRIEDALAPNSMQNLTRAINAARSHADAVFQYTLPTFEPSGEETAKIGCVRVFTPWKWVVGACLPLCDIREDLAAATRQWILVSVGILLAVGIISGYIMWQGIYAEHRRQEAEHTADMQQQQLIHAGKMVALGTLVAGVAHEINNPNQHIMMSAGLLSRAWEGAMPVLDQYFAEHGDFLIGGLYYSELRANMRTYTTAVLDGSARIRAIVDELRDFSRQEPAMGEPLAVNCNEVIRSSMLLLANLIKRSTRHFETDLDESCPCVNGSFRRLEQVVINLIQNACQALPGPERAIRISTRYQEEEDAVLVEVQDEGVGIPEDDIEKVFYPFFTTRRSSGGTGLGLSISLRIVEEHNGTLTFTSKPDKGTTARLSLPAAPQRYLESANGEDPPE